MGCDARPVVGSQVPNNLLDIQADIELAMQHICLTVDQACMANTSMVPTKWYAVASVY